MSRKYIVDHVMLKSIFDAFPAVVLVVDDDVRIQNYNAAAGELLSTTSSEIINRRGGEALHCINATDVPEGCGRGPSCMDCVIRNSVALAFEGNRIVRRRTKLTMLQDGERMDIYGLITASPFRYQESPFVLLVIEDISEIAELRRMIPICSVCRKVKDDKESWFRVESYFKKHWDVDFSHGLCPECHKVEMDKLARKFSSSTE